MNSPATHWFIVCVGLSACFFGGQAAVAQSQVLYRFVDKDGKTVVSDRPPLSGKYERIETDPNLNLMQSPKPATRGETNPSGSRATKSETLRDRLKTALDAARKRVAEAQQALEAGQEPREGEMRPIQVRPDNGGKPNSNGQVTAKNGAIICPIDPYGKAVCVSGAAPTEDYYARITQLEEDLRNAERELREAERRYRRESQD